MYPQQYFALRPAFPRSNTVFVAMPFAEQFNARWHHVIQPAIEGQGLQPYRVDAGKVSDSILTEILKLISENRLVFCDISTIGYIGPQAIRNGNVLYELGLAHAVRQPQEVLLFRSDDDALTFDLSNVRVNKYHPDLDVEAARKQVAGALQDALREIDLRNAFAVEQVARQLDFTAWMVLLEASDCVLHPVIRTMGETLTRGPSVEAISRLLELGALTTEWAAITPESFEALKDLPREALVKYRVTPLGQAVQRVGRAYLKGPAGWV